MSANRDTGRWEVDSGMGILVGVGWDGKRDGWMEEWIFCSFTGWMDEWTDKWMDW